MFRPAHWLDPVVTAPVDHVYVKAPTPPLTLVATEPPVEHVAPVIVGAPKTNRRICDSNCSGLCCGTSISICHSNCVASGRYII
jgi:hypothetical protein